MLPPTSRCKSRILGFFFVPSSDHHHFPPHLRHCRSACFVFLPLPEYTQYVASLIYYFYRSVQSSLIESCMLVWRNHPCKFEKQKFAPSTCPPPKHSQGQRRTSLQDTDFGQERLCEVLVFPFDIVICFETHHFYACAKR